MDKIFSARAALVIAAAVLMTTTMRAARETPTFAEGYGGQAAPTEQPSAKAIEFFEANVRPVLVESCFMCHAKAEAGGLRVDSREALLKGGSSGPAVVPGNPEESYLLRAVRHAPNAPKMPKNGAKLSDARIAALTQWIRDGAEWPAVAGAAAPPMATSHDKVITAEQRAFWSFQPLRRIEAPAVSRTDWAKSTIDRFILARLEKEGLSPVRSADTLTLIRRATLDLTGLPPTPEDVEAFEKDTSPGAFEKVVDRLLASRLYGETWGRTWLDVARYAEDDPRSLDPERRGYAPYPNAYLYRDWVVKAFNDDLPYDQFVKAQIAGDLLDEKMRARTLPALGLLGLGPWYYDNGAIEITKADERHDRVDVVSRGFLGLTVACARCHDHKYDPIPTNLPSEFITNDDFCPGCGLEYLASTFVDNGMSIKKLHREIMLSQVYQLSADSLPMNAAKDSGNRLYWRAGRRRMTAEQIRDSILSVSGALEAKVGGPAETLTPFYNRRTIYGRVSRYRIDPFLQLFDFPAPTISAEQRFATTVPLQRLFLMNSDFMQQQSELVARRVESEPDTRARIRKVYRLVFGRLPTDAELMAGVQYVTQEPLRAYEERKAEAAKQGQDPGPQGPAAPPAVQKPDPAMAEGMMAGVMGGADKKNDEAKKLLPVTAFGRYVKVLLSSNEFLFVN